MSKFNDTHQQTAGMETMTKEVVLEDPTEESPGQSSTLDNQKLTLRVISSTIEVFKKGLEINIDPLGLDVNYPFAMSIEDAHKFYNLRDEKDSFVYFGYNSSRYLSRSLSNSDYLATSQNDKYFASNGVEKILRLQTHMSDQISEGAFEEMKSDKKTMRNSSVSKIEVTAIQNEVSQIDFLVPIKESEDVESMFGRHFYIRYDKPSSTFRARDLGVGYGLFKRIQDTITLFCPTNSLEGEEVLINLGQSYLVLNYGREANQDSPSNLVQAPPSLGVKILKQEGGEEFTFESWKKEEIYIGRSEKCQVKVDDKLLSRIQ